MGVLSYGSKKQSEQLETIDISHDNAAGWGLNGDKLQSLIRYANTHLKAEDFENCYIVDYVLDGSDYNDELLGCLAAHPEYFGNHIDEPLVVIKNIPLMNILAMGAEKDSMRVTYNDINYVKFKDKDFVEKILSNRTKKLTIYGRPSLNEWMGKTTVQCVILDYELSEDESKYDF